VISRLQKLLGNGMQFSGYLAGGIRIHCWIKISRTRIAACPEASSVIDGDLSRMKEVTLFGNILIST
jgi:hypothetical protein